MMITPTLLSALTRLHAAGHAQEQARPDWMPKEISEWKAGVWFEVKGEKRFTQSCASAMLKCFIGLNTDGDCGEHAELSPTRLASLGANPNDVNDARKFACDTDE